MKIVRAFLFASVAVVAACSAQDDSSTDDELVTSDDGKADGASGKATAGHACLATPKYRKDKCKSGLVCNVAPPDRYGVCYAVGALDEPCDARFGDTDCSSGLVCVDSGDGINGSCAADGTTGAVCDPELVYTTCDSGLECTDDGVCASLGREGAYCRDGFDIDCDQGLVCMDWVCQPKGYCPGDGICSANEVCYTWGHNPPVPRCVVPHGYGESCDENFPCKPGLTCKSHWMAGSQYNCL